MAKGNELLISFYGDDFTGSTASLEALAAAGARTVLFIEPPTPKQLARYPGLDAVGVAGMSRSMSLARMEAELPGALNALKALGAPHVHYKVCSTFDSSPAIGSIGKVIDLATEIFDARFVPLLVGMPTMGRHCVFGNLFARFGSGGEIYRLDRHPSMSRHPITPADESDLRLHLARQTDKRIGLFDVLKVALAEEEAVEELEAIVSAGPEVILFDVLYAEQLPKLGRLIDAYASRDQPLFSVGSSDLEVALGAAWAADGRLTPVTDWKDSGKSGPLLVGSGSCSPVTARQIAWAVAHGFEEVFLDITDGRSDGADRSDKISSVALGGADLRQGVNEATTAAVAGLKAGRSVIVQASRASAEWFEAQVLDKVGRRAASAQVFGSALGQLLREAVKQTGVRRLSVAGGDTSGYAARELEIEAVEMIAPLTPGAPLCKAYAPGSPADGLEVNFKGGQVGNEDYFGIVARGRLNDE